MFAAFLTLGIRSYSYSDWMSYSHSGWQIGVEGFARGGLVLWSFHDDSGLDGDGFQHYHRKLTTRDKWYGPYPVNHVGMFCLVGHIPDLKIFFPVWSAWLLTAILPMIWILHPVLKKRPKGFCR
jgi:hypothetical protein